LPTPRQPLHQNQPDPKPSWRFDHPESQLDRRDRAHADMRDALQRRLHQLKNTKGPDADEIRQTAEVASWIANECSRKVEFMVSLWVGRTGLPEPQLRSYVDLLTSDCHAFMRAKLEELNLEIATHFMIWVIFERSSLRDERQQRLHAHLLICASADALPHFRLWRGERGRLVKKLWRNIVSDQAIWGRCFPSVKVRSVRHHKGGPEGTVLYLLKEVGHGSSTQLEPAATDPPAGSDRGEMSPGSSTPARRRLRRRSRADDQDIISFRSVRADGCFQDAFLRRRLCGLPIPSEWGKRTDSRALTEESSQIFTKNRHE